MPLLVAPELEFCSGWMFGRYADAIYPSPALMEAEFLNKVIQQSEKIANKGLLD